MKCSTSLLLFKAAAMSHHHISIKFCSCAFNLSFCSMQVIRSVPFSLSLLKARAPHSPVIIVGTHSDRLPQGKSAELKAAYRTRIQDLYLQPGGGYPEVNRIMEVSATTKEGTYVHVSECSQTGATLLAGFTTWKKWQLEKYCT